MKLKCPYCGSPRVKMVGGADGNPYNKNKLEKAVCHDCGMTVSTEAWHTGLHPYTLKPVFSAKSATDKLKQRMFFFWYKPEERRTIKQFLQKIRRPDIADRLFESANNAGARHNAFVEEPRNKPRHYEQERKAFFDKKKRRK